MFCVNTVLHCENLYCEYNINRNCNDFIRIIINVAVVKYLFILHSFTLIAHAILANIRIKHKYGIIRKMKIVSSTYIDKRCNNRRKCEHV